MALGASHGAGALLGAPNRPSARRSTNFMQALRTSSESSRGNDNGSSYGIIREVTTPPAVEKLATGTYQEPGDRRRNPHGHLCRRTDLMLTTTSSGVPARAMSAPRRARTSRHRRRKRKGRTSRRKRCLRKTCPRTRPTTIGWRRNQRFGTTVRLGPEVHDLGPPHVMKKPMTGIGHEAVTLNGRNQPR